MKISRPSLQVKGQGHHVQKRSPTACTVGNIIMSKEGMGTWLLCSSSLINNDISRESSDPDSTESLSVLDYWESSVPDIDFPLCWLEIHSTPYMNGRATTRGIFKTYVFFWSLSPLHTHGLYYNIWAFVLLSFDRKVMSLKADYNNLIRYAL